MTSKFVEIRDRATLIPALAIQLSGADGYLPRRAGFQSPMVYLIALSLQKAHYDPYDWGGGARTLKVAHGWLEKHFNDVPDHGVVDVEFILGETPTPKASESVTVPA